MIYPALNWHNWMDIYTGVHMFTLHVIPFVQTTIQVILTDMVLFEEDWWHSAVVGLVYIFFNAVGQWLYKTPLYPMTDWVKSPIGALLTLIAMSFAQAGLFYLWAKGVRVFKKWIDSKA